jgi:hypothetical protein
VGVIFAGAAGACAVGVVLDGAAGACPVGVVLDGAAGACAVGVVLDGAAGACPVGVVLDGAAGACAVGVVLDGAAGAWAAGMVLLGAEGACAAGVVLYGAWGVACANAGAAKPQLTTAAAVVFIKPLSVIVAFSKQRCIASTINEHRGHRGLRPRTRCSSIQDRRLGVLGILRIFSRVHRLSLKFQRVASFSATHVPSAGRSRCGLLRLADSIEPTERLQRRTGNRV